VTALPYGAIFHVSRGVLDPVDQISSADPFADHGIHSFAESRDRAAGVVCVSYPAISIKSMI
jgi:hypothetical protein